MGKIIETSTELRAFESCLKVVDELSKEKIELKKELEKLKPIKERADKKLVELQKELPKAEAKNKAQRIMPGDRSTEEKALFAFKELTEVEYGIKILKEILDIKEK